MQVTLNGLILGLAIALLATGFQLVYLPTKVFFLGIAGLYALAPYVYLEAGSLLGSTLGIVACLGVTLGLALTCEWANHGPLTRKGASDSAHLISSLGTYIILVEAVALIWGNNPRTLRSGLDSTVQFAGALLTRSQLLMAAVACAMLLAFLGMLRVTDLGLRLRALAENPVQFALLGYNVDRYRLIAFALSSLFAAASSLTTAYDIGFDPHTGLHAVLLAVVAVIIGGRESFAGPVAAALLLGFMRAQVVWYWSSRWEEAATFALLALFLLVRPYGLIGRTNRVAATV